MTKKTTPKLFLGLALLALGVILTTGRGNPKPTATSFEGEPVAIEGLEVFPQETNIPKRIVIPDLSIDLPVKKAQVVNGYWEVFEDTAAWGEGSGIPGKPGNQVIFAHAREGLFYPIRDISEGDNIFVLTDGSWYEYAVIEIKEVYPNETEVIAKTEDERLTLYTCSGFGDSKRLIVIATKVQNPA